MESPVLVVGLIAVATISLGATGGWLVSGRHGWEPGSSAIAMLRGCCGRDRTLLRVAPFSLSSLRALDADFAIRDAGRRPVAADGAIWTGRDIPPGRYRVWLDSGLNVSGTLTIALGKLDSTFEHCTFREDPPGASSCVVDLPAGATWLSMTPDQSMRSLVEGLRLQPSAVRAPDQCALRADRAVVTPAGIVFAEKGSVYAESTGIWVIGGKTARLSVQPHGRREFVVRNGSVANVVRIITGPSHLERRLAPGELITIPLYMPAAGAVVSVTVSSESGFRPAELEEKNLDFRWLGVWVELR